MKKIFLCAIFVFIVVGIWFYKPVWEQNVFEKNLNEQLQKYNEVKSQRIDLGELTDFDWDRVYFIHGYADTAEMMNDLDKELKPQSRIHLSGYIGENNYAVVFAKGKSIVQSAVIYASRGKIPDYMPLVPVSMLKKEQAVFKIVKGELFVFAESKKQQ
jgi:hypothetical protein